MIKMLKLDLNILFSQKVMMITLLNLFIVMLLFLMFSNFFVGDNLLINEQGSFFLDYLFESITFLKINIVLNSVFITLSCKKLIIIDHILLARKSYTKVLLSRIISIIIINFILTSIMYVLFLLIGNFLTTYMGDSNYISLYLYLLIFNLFYILVSYMIYILFKNSYALLFVIALYLVGSSFTPYMATNDSILISEKIVSLLINDLIFYENLQFGFMYGMIYVLSLNSLLLIIVFKHFFKSDII